MMRLFSSRWWKQTVLVLLAMGVMIRLGIWQLDRLEQRKAFNARVTAQIQQPPLLLTAQSLEENLSQMEYRQVITRGEFLFEEEIALRNQYWENRWGVHLLTPMVIENSQQAVLVDRGWIPAEAFASGDWSAFRIPGKVEIHGIIRLSQSKADFGTRSDRLPENREERLLAWNFVNIPLIQAQASVDLLPIYIQQAPDAGVEALPYRALPEIELSEGPHLGYALQWFTFALILGVGYPYLVRQQELKAYAQAKNSPPRLSSTKQVIHAHYAHPPEK